MVWSYKKSLLIAGGLFTGGWIFIAVIFTWVHTASGLAQLDRPLTEWLAGHRSSAVTVSLQTITHVFDPFVLLCLVPAGAIWWAWRKKEYWRPVLLAASFYGAFGLSLLIKELVARERPTTTIMALPLETGFSFPSNHVFGIAVLGLILGYLIYSRRASHRFLAGWLVGTLGGAAIMALSRVYLGYHWLTDVTASIGLACVVLALVITADTLHAKLRSTSLK